MNRQASTHDTIVNSKQSTNSQSKGGAREYRGRRWRSGAAPRSGEAAPRSEEAAPRSGTAAPRSGEAAPRSEAAVTCVPSIAPMQLLNEREAVILKEAKERARA